MAQIFQVLLARVGVRVGRRYFALKKTGCLRGFLQGQCRDRAGQGESGSSVVVFSNNQNPSFPSRANLEKQRPTWWQWGSSPFWKQPETDAGTMWEWRPVGAPLKPREINRRNESARRKWEEEWVCPHCHQSDLWIWTAQVHTHTWGEGTYEIPLRGLPDDGRDRLVTMTLRMKGTAEVGWPGVGTQGRKMGKVPWKEI